MHACVCQYLWVGGWAHVCMSLVLCLCVCVWLVRVFEVGTSLSVRDDRVNFHNYPLFSNLH